MPLGPRNSGADVPTCHGQNSWWPSVETSSQMYVADDLKRCRVVSSKQTPSSVRTNATSHARKSATLVSMPTKTAFSSAMVVPQTSNNFPNLYDQEIAATGNSVLVSPFYEALCDNVRSAIRCFPLTNNVQTFRAWSAFVELPVLAISRVKPKKLDVWDRRKIANISARVKNWEKLMADTQRPPDLRHYRRHHVFAHEGSQCHTLVCDSVLCAFCMLLDPCC